MNVRDRLVDTLEDHGLTWGSDCVCGQEIGGERWQAQHTADALIATPGVLIIETPDIDAMAKAMYNARGQRVGPWEELSEVGWKAEYRRMAQAALDAAKNGAPS